MSDSPSRRDTDESSANIDPFDSRRPTDIPDTSGADAADVTDTDEVGYAATVVSHDDAPNECTVFPIDASDEERVTTWVSASGDSFVPLAEWR
jgi:hypothetical protein